jgi:hypothetical protein
MSVPGSASTADQPVASLNTGELESELLGLAGHIAAAQCRFLQLLAEFDRRDGWAGLGLRSCAHWLSWKAGMSLRTAAEHLRVAHALAKLPRVTEAFAAGRISYSKVRAIARVTADLPDDLPDEPPDEPDPAEPGTVTDFNTDTDTGVGDTAEGENRFSADPEQPPGPRWAPAEEVEQTLLKVAMAGTATHLEAVVRAVRHRTSDPAGAHTARSLSWRWAADGSLVLRGRLAPADGAALVAAIEALVPPHATRPEPCGPPSGWKHRAVEHAPGAATDRIAARRADALLTLISTATDPDVDREPDDEPEAAARTEQRARHRRRPAVRRGQAKIIVHVDAPTGTAQVPGGPELPPATAERLACDARVQLLLSDRRTNRLYLGRTRRLATPAQIAALTVRDGNRCQFPGCTHTRHLHAHHVRPWWAGGPTDLDNLVLVCSFHHRLIHDHGYRLRLTGDRWEALRPDGTEVPQSAGPLSGDLDELISYATRTGRIITPDSLTPTWSGERLDPQPILDALLPRHGSAATAA